MQSSKEVKLGRMKEENGVSGYQEMFENFL